MQEDNFHTLPFAYPGNRSKPTTRTSLKSRYTEVWTSAPNLSSNLRIQLPNPSKLIIMNMPKFGHGVSTRPEYTGRSLEPIFPPPEIFIQLPPHYQVVAIRLRNALLGVNQTTNLDTAKAVVWQVDVFLQWDMVKLLCPGYVNKFTEPGKTILKQLLNELYRVCEYIGGQVNATAYKQCYDYLVI